MGLREGQFNDKNLPSVNKTITVLKALNTGRPIQIGSYKFKLGETVNGGFQPLMQFDVTNSQGEEYIEYMGYQGDMMSFSALCNNLTEEELTIISAENVLNNLRS